MLGGALLLRPSQTPPERLRMAMAEVGGGQSQGPRAGELFPPALEGHLAAVARAEADRVAPTFWYGDGN